MLEVEEKFTQFYERAFDATEHFDTMEALRSLRDLDAQSTVLPVQTANDPDIIADINDLRERLRCVAFPELSIEEACQMLSHEILSFLRKGIDFGNRLSVRYVFVGYDKQESERKLLQAAILSNKELLGEMTIGEWLKAFDAAFNPENRAETAVKDFFLNDRRIANLSKDEQAVLKEVLAVYDRWLASELISVFDLAAIIRNVGIPSSEADRATSVSSGTGVRRALPGNLVVRLPLLSAIGKYPKLGEQQVTDGRIRVKGQPEPVRPSLANWMKCYRDELGVGFHDPVLRAKFLFNSANGKGLSSGDRERVNLLIRSIEENVPLDIDAQRSEIMFPSFDVKESLSATAPTPARIATPARNTSHIDAGGQSVAGGLQSRNETSARLTPAPVSGRTPLGQGSGMAKSAEPVALVPGSGTTPPVPATFPPKNLPVSPVPVAKPSIPAPSSVPATAQTESFPKPPQAPRRDVGAERKSAFAIHPIENPLGEASPSVSASSLGSISFDEVASPGAGLRMAKGMSFTSLEARDVPKEDAPANLSFSSGHTFPTEKESSGEFSISKPQEKPLPSSIGFTSKRDDMPTDRAMPEQEDAPARRPAAPAPKANPFHIRPMKVSEEEKNVLAGISGNTGASGRIVNLREDAE